MEGRNDDGYLSADRVRELYVRCAVPEHTSDTSHTQVSAWLLRHTFKIERLTQNRESIIRMLLCLPAGYRIDVSGGGSVIEAIRRADGTQWTDDVTDVERLLALGMALELASFCVSREHWDKLPMACPYFRVDITALGVSVN